MREIEIKYQHTKRPGERCEIKIFRKLFLKFINYKIHKFPKEAEKGVNVIEN